MLRGASRKLNVISEIHTYSRTDKIICGGWFVPKKNLLGENWYDKERWEREGGGLQWLSNQILICEPRVASHCMVSHLSLAPLFSKPPSPPPLPPFPSISPPPPYSIHRTYFINNTFMVIYKEWTTWSAWLTYAPSLPPSTITTNYQLYAKLTIRAGNIFGIGPFWQKSILSRICQALAGGGGGRIIRKSTINQM